MNKEVIQAIMVMQHTYGRDISKFDEFFLLKSLEKRWRATGVENAAEYCNYLQKNPTEADIFYNSLNITYSQFFRDPLAFALLEQVILPGLIAQKSDGGVIRIWSAGCSCGQEAYSIAMLLTDLIAAGEKAIRFRIFATDISQTALSFAQEGVYGQETVQNVKFQLLNKYFSKKGETYTIVPQLRQNINFSIYDLLDQTSVNPPESIYGDFDIVFCSNLLFYYKADVQQFIAKKLQKSMSSIGYLLTSEAERAIIGKVSALQMITPLSTIFKKV